jgi:hypothetical protein
VKGQVSHPYRTRSKIMGLYTNFTKIVRYDLLLKIHVWEPWQLSRYSSGLWAGRLGF